jgi:hypothetical protein
MGAAGKVEIIMKDGARYYITEAQAVVLSQEMTSSQLVSIPGYNRRVSKYNISEMGTVYPVPCTTCGEALYPNEAPLHYCNHKGLNDILDGRVDVEHSEEYQKLCAMRELVRRGKSWREACIEVKGYDPVDTGTKKSKLVPKDAWWNKDNLSLEEDHEDKSKRVEDSQDPEIPF